MKKSSHFSSVWGHHLTRISNFLVHDSCSRYIPAQFVSLEYMYGISLWFLDYKGYGRESVTGARGVMSSFSSSDRRESMACVMDGRLLGS